MDLEFIPLPVVQSKTCNSKFSSFFRKMFKFEQMDFQFALWQIVYLFIAPQKLSKIFRARKVSKLQYARDDPAFLVLFLVALFITSIGLGYQMDLTLVQFLKFLFLITFLDCACIGVVVCTIFWTLTNRILKPINSKIEWGFSFDVHLNAIFPPVILLHLLQIIFFNVWLIGNNMAALCFGNTFLLFGAIYYIYITFLGYNSILVVRDTKMLLFPIPWIIFIYLFTLFFNVNLVQVILYCYIDRAI